MSPIIQTKLIDETDIKARSSSPWKLPPKGSHRTRRETLASSSSYDSIL
jgi:hypothetical protein